MTIALARRYRPKRFADLLVQDHVTAVLRGAVAKGRVGHGYLLTGPRGVGKTTAARILAMALNCPDRSADGDPCGECESCARIWSGAASLDVVEIDAASNRGVDDARDLRERAMYAASQEGHHKVYIVDEAHMLTREAWNALLKILEEPPPRVVFVFATTEPQKIAATAAPVMSRLQRFDFRRIGPKAIRDRLREVLATERIAAEDDALTLIARHADGGMRDALSILDQCLSFGEGAITPDRVREILGLVADELYGELLGIVVERRPAGVFPLVARLVEAGADLPEFLNGAGEMLRALLMVQLGTEPEGLTEAMRQTLERYRSALEPGDVLRMLRLLADNEAALRRSASPRLIAETLLLRWAMLDRIVDLQQALAAGGAPPASSRGAAGDEAIGSRMSHPIASDAPRPRNDPRGAAPQGAVQPGAAQPGAAQPSATPPVRPSAPATPAADLAEIQARWPDAVAALRTRSRFLGEALSCTDPTGLEGPVLTATIREANPLFSERLADQRAAAEEVLTEVLGRPVQLRIEQPGSAEAAPRPQRLTQDGVKADRLKGLRAQDPALDAAADELDLEIVE